MHLQGKDGSLVVSFHGPNHEVENRRSARPVDGLSIPKALTLVPYFMHLAGLKWHEYDECALANPNRCKVKIGLMHEGSARAGIIIIGGIFR